MQHAETQENKYLNKSYKNVTKCEYLCDTRRKAVMGMAKKSADGLKGRLLLSENMSSVNWQ